MQLKFKEKKIEKHYCLFVISSHNYFTKYETGLNLDGFFARLLGGFAQKTWLVFWVGIYAGF